MKPWQEVDITGPGIGTYWDEPPLWSAPFACMLLEVVPLRHGLSVLEVTRTESDSFRIRFADGTSMLDHHLIRIGFLGDWRTLVPKASVDAVFGRLEERLNDLARRQGELSLTIAVVCVVATQPEAAA